MSQASAPVKVQSLSGTPAPASVPTPVARGQEAVIPVVDVQPAPAVPPPVVVPAAPQNRFVQAWKGIGGGSLMVSLLIHAGLLIAAFFIVQTIVHEKKVDFLPGGGSKAAQAASQDMSQQVQMKKRNAFQKNIPMQRLVSTSSTSTISLPDTPVDAVSMPDMGSLMGGASMSSGGFGSAGAGGGFGSGVGIGGLKGISFFGMASPLERVVFVLDYSGSMKPNQLDLVNNEMQNTLRLLPPRAEYQVVMFGGGARFADNTWKMENVGWPPDPNRACLITHRPTKKEFRFAWDETKKDFIFQGADSELPTDRWLRADPNNVRRTMNELRKTDGWNGTHWGWGFKLALNMKPAPKTIYFMTDGVGGSNVKEILKYNKEVTKANAQINTLLMHTSQGATQMNTLAKESGGKFTIVFNDGNTVDGDTYFKEREKYDEMLKAKPKK